jgi:hypothetical protein
MKYFRFTSTNPRGHLRARLARKGSIVLLLACVLAVVHTGTTEAIFLTWSQEAQKNGTAFYDPSACGATDSTTGGTGSIGAEAPGGTIQMQRVDLSQFHPDPNAVKYFNKTALAKMKKYIPLYTKAAQAEGVIQNWEILPALHGPELDFQNYYKPNGIVGGSGGPSGPYQETAREMTSYLKDPTYGPVLKTLVTPSGNAIPHKTLTDDQFVILSRLVYHRWVKQSLGSSYSKLKEGPIPFTPKTDSSNFLTKVMGRWNSGSVVEGFNGYDTGAHKYNPRAAVNPGMATTYYLLKDWEAHGGMVTVGGGGSNCDGGGSGAAVNCTPTTTAPATGGTSAPATTPSTPAANTSAGATILCIAKKYNGIYYKWGGGHGGSYANFKKNCPDPTHPPNNTSGGSNPCGTDCSGLVSMVIDEFSGKNYNWLASVGDLQSSGVWKRVNDLTAVQPGDVVLRSEHIEFVDHYDTSKHNLVTFGSHHTGAKTSNVTTPLSYWSLGAFRYTGPGSDKK